MMGAYQIVLDARMAVCEALFYEGLESALGTIAKASMMLAPRVSDGTLMHHVAWDALQQVSENLRLVEYFGQEAVQAAIAFGPLTLERAPVRSVA